MIEQTPFESLAALVNQARGYADQATAESTRYAPFAPLLTI